jgi:hypothetical protein
MPPTSFEGIIKSLQLPVQLFALTLHLFRLASYEVQCIVVHLHDSFRGEHGFELRKQAWFNTKNNNVVDKGLERNIIIRS